MDTLRNVICSRWERRPLVGLAHLWLRHLPVSFVYRMACLNMEWRDARDALLDRRGGLDVLLDALAAGGEEALAAARLEIHPHLDSGSPPLSDLWVVGRGGGSGRPGHVGGGADAAAPAAALGPNWLALMTGRAQEDGVAGW